MNAPSDNTQPRLTSLAHGGGCGCKIAPGVLRDILSNMKGFALPPALLVGIDTSDDAAVYLLNDQQALIATTDFFMPVVDDPFDFLGPWRWLRLQDRPWCAARYFEWYARLALAA